jgi:hypothetical protein
MKAVWARNFEVAQNPIFIVGYPRSGTTLLQALLTTQEHVVSFPETHFFSIVVKQIQTQEQRYIDRCCLAQVLKTIQAQMDLEIAPEVAGQLSESPLGVKRLFEWIVWQYVGEDAKARWVEKTPDHVRNLDQISALYPAVRFVNIVRHPIYAVYSNKRTPLSQKRSLIWLADAWKDASAAYERYRAANPHAIYSVRYEDLAADPERVMMGVCDFVGVPFQRERLADYKAASDKLILERESWKADVRSRDIANMNVKYRVAARDALQIQYVAGATMRRYGYAKLHPARQSVYDAAFALRGVLSRVKRRIERGIEARSESRA